jgi:formate-dependent nitrite reductase membrane component NrfD
MALHHEWGWMVVVYLFLGGLGGGCLALSGLVQLAWPGRYRGLARAGALAAPVLVGAGAGLLVFDLGQPLRFWRLFVTVNPESPMSIGSWLLLFFVLLGGASALLHLPPAGLRALARHGRRLAPALRALADWNEPGPAGAEFPQSPPAVRRLRRALAFAGIPLGLGVGIYTGVLLGAIPARPFWNTPMVAQLFLFSALSTSAALLMLLRAGGGEAAEQERRLLLRVDLVFIALELFIIIPFILHGQLGTRSVRSSLDAILGGPYTSIFWLWVVTLGILVPLALELADFGGATRRLPRRVLGALHLAVPALILLGGYLLRWIFVHAGQDSSFL